MVNLKHSFAMQEGTNPNPNPNPNPNRNRNRNRNPNRNPNPNLSSPSLAATLNLLLLRWLDHDYPAAFQLCGCCGSDTPLSTEEAQLWALLADLHEEHEPPNPTPNPNPQP